MADFLTTLLGPSEAKAISIDSLLSMFFAHRVSKSGQHVDYYTVLRVSAACACCRVLAEGVAQIPFKLYRDKQDGSHDVATEKSLNRILSRRPNADLTSFQFRETMMYHALLSKGGFAVINWVRGDVAELFPVAPERVRIEQQPDGTVRYWLTMPDGSQDEIPRKNLMILQGPSWDNVVAMELIDLAREALGLAMATEETHSTFHRNGARVAGLISMEGTLNDQGRKNLKQMMQEATTGANAYKTLVMDQSAKFTQMSMTGVDAQHIQVREHQIVEVCRFFRVFPMMVGHADKTATFASAEQFFIAHVTHSLGPWIARFEQAADRDLLSQDEIDQGYYCNLIVEGLLRGDAASRVAYYTGMYNMGALNPNEIRALENRNPYPGGEQYRVMLNTAPNQPVPTPTPTATPAKADDADGLEQKAGRVLSAINERRIVGARDLLQEVLSELESEPDDSALLGTAKDARDDEMEARLSALESRPAIVINTPPVTVNHQAGDIKFAPQEIALPPINVKAGDTHISLPNGKTIRTVERDEDGQITKIVDAAS